MKRIQLLMTILAGVLLLASPALAKSVYLPHLTGSSAPGWTDIFQADNMGEAPASFTLTLYNAGAQVFSQAYTVAAKSKLVLNIKTQVSGTGTTGIVTYTDTALGFRYSYVSDTGGLAEFYLGGTLRSAVALYYSDFSTVLVNKGAAVANLTGASQSVTLYALGAGSVLGQYTTTIGAYGKIIGAPSTWFPALAASQVEKIIAVAGSACLDALAIGSDATLARMVFVPGQDAYPFVSSTFTQIYWTSSSAAIASGWYQVACTDTDSGYYFIPVTTPGMDTSGDFSIVTAVKRVSGSDISEFGVTVSWLDGDNKVDFSIFSDGWIGVYRKEAGDWMTYVEMPAAAVSTGNDVVNVLKFVKLGDMFYFYVNNIEVYSVGAFPLPGSNVGFHVYGVQTVAADYITVSEAQ